MLDRIDDQLLQSNLQLVADFLGHTFQFAESVEELCKPLQFRDVAVQYEDALPGAGVILPHGPHTVASALIARAKRRRYRKIPQQTSRSPGHGGSLWTSAENSTARSAATIRYIVHLPCEWQAQDQLRRGPL